MTTTKKFTQTVSVIEFGQTVKKMVPNLKKINSYVCDLIEKNGNPIAPGCSIYTTYGFMETTRYFSVTLFANDHNRTLTVYDFSSEIGVKDFMLLVDRIFHGEIDFGAL